MKCVVFLFPIILLLPLGWVSENLPSVNSNQRHEFIQCYVEVTREQSKKLFFHSYPEMVPVGFGNLDDDKPKAIGWYDPKTGHIKALVEIRIKATPEKYDADLTVLCTHETLDSSLVYLKEESDPKDTRNLEHFFVTRTKGGKEVLVPTKPLISGLSELHTSKRYIGDTNKIIAYKEGKPIEERHIRNVANKFQQSQVEIKPSIGTGGLARVEAHNRGNRPAFVKARPLDRSASVTPSQLVIHPGQTRVLTVTNPGRKNIVNLAYSEQPVDNAGRVGGNIASGELTQDRYIADDWKLQAISQDPNTRYSLNGTPLKSADTTTVDGSDKKRPWYLAALPVAPTLIGLGYNVFTSQSGGAKPVEGGFTVVPGKVL